ncbi:MAG: class I mannose-6-phosphate isomerase [Pseudomonadota bacterium]|nr:class I mannose-6-phosphate isomerase [Pseudomonadota bacterium]
MVGETVKLDTKIVDKPWGRCGIDPRFGVDAERQVGEIWFEPPAGRELDVMAKYLFTTERLSIQVHPDDATAHARGHRSGKDECWIILDVEDDAELGIGTVREAAASEVIDAARDGSIVELIDWRRPMRGDFIYNPAGTIHALGPGLTVLEIQQAVDLTYRLYDYGRPRELHLDEAADVVQARPHQHRLDGKVGNQSALLVAGPYFGVAWCVGEPPVLPQAIREVQLLPIDAAVGGIGPGECALIDARAARALRSSGTFVLAWSVVK